MSRVLTVVTRSGALATAQTRMVAAALKAKHEGLEIRITEVTSEGDRDRDTVLWNLKDKGFFTSRLEEMLLAGEADFAVHSYKDLPTRSDQGLTVAAVCDRHHPEDCLLAMKPLGSVADLPEGARIGTASLRRIAQLRHLRADLELVPIRGNVQTRIEKLETGDLDGIILARAGLERLGLAEKITLAFDPHVFVSAPAQGALAIQTKADDEATNEIIASMDDALARALTDAERQVLIEMKCGCHAPVGAYAECMDDVITVNAFVSDVHGRKLLTARATGPRSDAPGVGASVAAKLLDAGGRQILDDLENERDHGGVNA